MKKELLINAGITLVVVVAGVVIAQKWIDSKKVKMEKKQGGGW